MPAEGFYIEDGPWIILSFYSIFYQIKNSRGVQMFALYFTSLSLTPSDGGYFDDGLWVI